MIDESERPEGPLRGQGAASSEIAEKVFEEAVSNDPDNAAKHCKLADIYKRKRKTDLAEEEYKNAVRLNPGNDAYHWSLGQFYEYDGDKLILAEAAYKEALRLSPNNPHNRLCLGRVYEKQGKLALAEAEYRILSESSPAYGDLVARICEKLGKTEAAIEEYGKASERPEAVSRAVKGRGKKGLLFALILVMAATIAVVAVSAYIIMEYRDAEIEYTSKIEEAEAVGKAVSLKARAEVTLVNEKLALIASERDRLKTSEKASRHLASATEAALLGQYDKAIREFRSLIEQDPKSAVSYYWLGYLYSQKGQLDEAKTFYLNASKLGLKDADKALKALEAGRVPGAQAPTVARTTPGAPAPKPSDAFESSRPKEQAELSKIVKVYETSFLGKGGGISRIHHSDYLVASKEDIIGFVASLQVYADREGFADTGIFLSGLINNLNEDIELDLTHIKEPLHYIGAFLNANNMTIRGDVGLFLGRSQRSGRITLEGNAGACVGRSMEGGEILIKGSVGESAGYFMRSGTIVVEGKAGRKAGNWMEGGKLIIKGDAGQLVGSNMSGGTISLEGGVESLSRKIPGGEIYHKGIRINQ